MKIQEKATIPIVQMASLFITQSNFLNTGNEDEDEDEGEDELLESGMDDPVIPETQLSSPSHGEILTKMEITPLRQTCRKNFERQERGKCDIIVFFNTIKNHDL